MRYVGVRTHILSRVASTNTFAMQQYKAGCAGVGEVFFAHAQTVGRGQRTHVWQSAAGKNLTFSFILDISFLSVDDLFRLMQTCALACHEYLVLKLKKTQSVRIKWLNDLYVNEQKIAGILIDNLFESSTQKTAVIGMGINLMQCEFPPEIATRATSLRLLTSQNYTPLTELERLCDFLNNYISLLHGGEAERAHLHAAYNEVLYKKNEIIFVDGRQAQVVGVNEQGHLCVQYAIGASEVIRFDEGREIIW